MNIRLKHTEGVILKVIPFGDHDQIISLFTRDAGIIKVMGCGKKNGRAKELYSPLMVAEVAYVEKSSEIYRSSDFAIIDYHHELRKSLKHLKAGCDLIQAIAYTQQIGSHASALYHLLRYFLNKIPSLSNPDPIPSSFRLKLLLHEGVFTVPLVCGMCGKHLDKAAFLNGSEWYCEDHRGFRNVEFSSEDIDLLYLLTCSQSFQTIASCPLSSLLIKKIADFFNESFR